MDRARATRLSKALARAGFIALGGFHPEPEDRVPDCGTNAPPPGFDGEIMQGAVPLSSPRPGGEGQGERVSRAGLPTRTLLLIGSAGPALFDAFTESPEASDGRPDPLDRYTARLLRDIADEFGLTPVFPFDGPPWHPFQAWALRAGGFSPSPVGVLCHAAFGPWAAFRAAFLSAERFGTFEQNGKPGPCGTCEEKPCIAACPADALSLEAGYDVPRCREYLKANRKAHCRAGCLARRACPFGRQFAQSEGQAKFHMTSFLRGAQRAGAIPRHPVSGSRSDSDAGNATG